MLSWCQRRSQPFLLNGKRGPVRVSLGFERLECRALFSTFTVLNTLDAGPGSLRQAILDANASPAGGSIVFNIPATDPNFIDVDAALTGGDGLADAWRITPLSELPELTHATAGITIDGHTQTAFAGNLNAFGPEIVLDGNGVFARGLVLRTNGHTVAGLNIQRFGRSGVDLFNGNFNTVVGNYIGTDATGTTAAGNQKYGVAITAGANNRVGTDGDGINDTAERNVIGANTFDGVAISGAGSDDNVVAGNYLGVNATATAALGNVLQGVAIYNGAKRNRIGTNADGIADVAEMNVISGNLDDGVGIHGSGTTHNVVAGNFIGTNSASDPLGNKNYGVLISGGATDNVIGGNTSAARNVISSNGLSGVRITAAATSTNRISGNFIGTDVTGQTALGNGNVGVLIDTGATYNIVGTDSNGLGDVQERNIISGNLHSGVLVHGTGTNENVLAGNFIGTGVGGSAAVANGEHGVSVRSGASSNRIGTNGDGVADALERNVIGGNQYGGVILYGANTSRNVVAGNLVGINAAGTGVVPNQMHGIELWEGATNNRIGTNANGVHDDAEANVVGGNVWAGVSIHGVGTAQNEIAGNYIGTDRVNSTALGNLQDGIILFSGAKQNVIGGRQPASRNVISGNGFNGVRISGVETSSNHVAGNFIGTDTTGQLPLANVRRGVIIDTGASANILGTNGDGVGDASERNVISANGGSGITITGAGTSENAISGNYVGTNASGTASLGNGQYGVAITTGASSNRIGTNADGKSDALESNTIGGNTSSGIGIIGSGTTQNVVAGNFVGTNISDANLANKLHGISVFDSASSNTIGGTLAGTGNVIRNNLGVGVAVHGEATVRNALLRNSIAANTSHGIDLGSDGASSGDSDDADAGANQLQNSPLLHDALLVGQTLTVDFEVDSLPANSAYPLRIEFFSVDATGQQGQSFLGFTTLSAVAPGTLKRVSLYPLIPVAAGERMVATATDANGNTSEFSLENELVVAVENPWHNLVRPLDVNADRTVAPGDALAVINYLNAFGAGAVPVAGPSGPDYYDTGNDGQVSPADVLNIINAINAGLAQGESSMASTSDTSVSQEATDEALLSFLLSEVAPPVKPRRSR